MRMGRTFQIVYLCEQACERSSSPIATWTCETTDPPTSRTVVRVSDDPYRLERFVEAQSNGVHAQSLDELRAGRKRSHWMWFVFPQVAGLGLSPTSQRYAVGSLDEARAYLDHPVLGPRLVECATAVLGHTDLTAREVMGSPDDAKLRSSMTLFALAADSEPVFEQVLDAFFAGKRDPRTAEILGS
jgi:uncharacterized protein (DUF1810 family)